MDDDSTFPETVISKLAVMRKAEQAVGSATVKPKGPKSAVKDTNKPGSIKGLAAPDQTAGPGRGNSNAATLEMKTKVKGASDDAATIKKPPAGAGSNQEFLYVSKKDFPQAPKGTVDSTPNSWKVPAGIGRQLQAQTGEAPEEPPTSDAQATSFGKQKNKRDTLIAHLKDGTIASKERTVGDNVSETYKVVIQGNGAGLMKPVVNHYTLKNVEYAKEPGQGPGWKYDGDSEQWFKEDHVQLNPYDNKFFGAGAGNLPFRKQPQREAAGHTVGQMHGLDNVPVTVVRSENGQEHSVQEWRDGLKDITSIKKQKDPEGKAQRDIEVLRQLVPSDKRAAMEQKIMDMAVHDIISNNNDRHAHNFLVHPETGDITLIDHGLAFANGMHGVRSHLLQNVFHKKQKIQISESMQKRLGNLSYNDYKRGMSGLQDWEAGQTFLRNRYVGWLQKNHGEIDRQKFLHTESSNDGTIHLPGDASNWSFSGASAAHHENEFEAREEEGMLPYQLFESWAKGFLKEASSDPNHKDHSDAKELSRIGVFMDRGYMGRHGGDAEYRAKGMHKIYESTIKANMDVPKDISAHMNRANKTVESRAEAGTFDPGAEEAPAPRQPNSMERAPTAASPSNKTAPKGRRN